MTDQPPKPAYRVDWRKPLAKAAVVSAAVPVVAELAAIVALIAGAGSGPKTWLVLIAYVGSFIPVLLGSLAVLTESWNSGNRGDGCCVVVAFGLLWVGWLTFVSLLAVILIGTDIAINS